MASTTLSVVVPTITGTAQSTKTGVASSQTLTVACATAQGSLDLRSLVVRCTNTISTEAVSLSLDVSTEYSDLGIGAATIAVASDSTVIIGGHLFESSRFLTTSGTIVFTQSGTGPTTWEACQAPRATE